jgi:hypothetical protein
MHLNLEDFLIIEEKLQVSFYLRLKTREILWSDLDPLWIQVKKLSRTREILVGSGSVMDSS